MIGVFIMIGFTVAGVISAIAGMKQFNRDMAVPCQWGCEE